MDKQAHRQKLLRLHAPHYVHAEQNRLSGIIVDPDGTAYATDARHLIRLTGAFDPPDVLQVRHPKTLKPVKLSKETDQPPSNMSKLIPERHTFDATMELDIWDVPDVILHVDALQTALSLVDSRHMTGRLYTADGQLLLSFRDPEVTGQVQIAEMDGYVNVLLDVRYLYRALCVFRDAGTDEVRIGFKGKEKPILLWDAEQGLDIMILPKREVR